jgi:hypothetical protein
MFCQNASVSYKAKIITKSSIYLSKTQLSSCMQKLNNILKGKQYCKKNTIHICVSTYYTIHIRNLLTLSLTRSTRCVQDPLAQRNDKIKTVAFERTKHRYTALKYCC